MVNKPISNKKGKKTSFKWRKDAVHALQVRKTLKWKKKLKKKN